MKRISFSDLNKFFSVVNEQMKVYLPVDRNDGKSRFELWDESKSLSANLNTERSAKDFFFPQTENLMDFKVKDKSIELIDTRSEVEDFAIFGVRACDAKSFEILDRVFLCDPVDTYYQSRREHGVVITLACTRPAETCFCSSFDIDATAPGGDVTVWFASNYYYFEANTDKGVSFMSKFDRVFEDSDDVDVKAQNEKTKQILDKLPLKDVTFKGIDPKDTIKIFNSKLWDEISESCLGCGTCTFVCPTCQCYDIRDFDTGNGIKRYRCWDSCMYSEFTRMAHGNSRNSQSQRFRQRFMHKLVYFPENNEGIYGCVGCGRCLAKCPISMNIVKVAKAIKEDLK